MFFIKQLYNKAHGLIKERIIRSEYYSQGFRVLNDSIYLETIEKTNKVLSQRPYRHEIINFLISTINRDVAYLEIGVRNPEDNFIHINTTKKWGVDPGVEFKENPVAFPMTSDDFFSKFRNGLFRDLPSKFDVIFIDGLHLAEQVERDIENALEILSSDGFIVMHDCNPPSEWHARETMLYNYTPALGYWNGTTWKAFYKIRTRKDLKACCVDTDWGVGIISKTAPLGDATELMNPFFEYGTLDKQRNEMLNLISFDKLKETLNSSSKY